jgi:hypothetical protein
VSENSASLTQFSINYRWWLFTLSSFGALAEILLLSPPSSLFFKRDGRYEYILFQLFPLSNSIREGELKGVSKSRKLQLKVKSQKLKVKSRKFLVNKEFNSLNITRIFLTLFSFHFQLSTFKRVHLLKFYAITLKHFLVLHRISSSQRFTFCQLLNFQNTFNDLFRSWWTARYIDIHRNYSINAL